MARKLKKSTLFFSWNCFWSPALAHGMEQAGNDLCLLFLCVCVWVSVCVRGEGGIENGLMITTLNTAPGLPEFLQWSKISLLYIISPMRTPNMGSSMTQKQHMLKSIHSAKILLTKDLKDKPALNLALSQGNIWKDLPLKIVFKTFPFTIETGFCDLHGNKTAI